MNWTSGNRRGLELDRVRQLTRSVPRQDEPFHGDMTDYVMMRRGNRSADWQRVYTYVSCDSYKVSEIASEQDVPNPEREQIVRR